MKSLDTKLANIHADPGGASDFILAAATDPDMARGLAAPGIDPVSGQRRSLADFRDQVAEIVYQGLVDIVLMSVSTSEQLTVEQRLFEGSAITPAARGNDTTDVHELAGANYPQQASRPFRTATVEQITGAAGVDLALYSITPCNDAALDVAALEAYRAFRLEAERAGLRHFLEAFVPNVVELAPPDPARFLNDFVARTLAGVPRDGRPLFLKMPYGGPRAMEELAAYDPHLIPGVLGGSSGTTYDAFLLLEDARRHGARAALFGRKIMDSDHPLTFVRHLRAIADGEMQAREACRSYHSELDALGLNPRRSLDEDLVLTETWNA